MYLKTNLEIVLIKYINIKKTPRMQFCIKKLIGRILKYSKIISMLIIITPENKR